MPFAPDEAYFQPPPSPRQPERKKQRNVKTWLFIAAGTGLFMAGWAGEVTAGDASYIIPQPEIRSASLLEAYASVAAETFRERPFLPPALILAGLGMWGLSIRSALRNG